MASSEQVTTVGTWAGNNTDVSAVQAQLTRLWRDAAEQAQRQGLPAAARTSVLTLVAYAEDPRTIERVSEAIAALVEHHPSRAVLVLAEPGASPSLDTEISTRCLVARPHVCHEQILLRAHGTVVEQLSSAVSSLLLRDLPTFLWWPSDVAGNPDILRRLIALSDRLIVDSATSADPVASLKALSQIIARRRGIAVTDMQWARLTGWREVTAQFFDAGSARHYLAAIEQVRIDVDGDHLATAPMAGLLFAGWLASRLGWRPATDRTQLEPPGRYAVNAGGRSIAIELRARPNRPGGERQLASVSLLAGRDGRTVSFSIEQQTSDTMTTRVEGGDFPTEDRHMQLADASDARLLTHELGIFGRDRAYEEALSVAVGLLRVDAGAE